MGGQEVTKRKTCIWVIVVRRRGWTRRCGHSERTRCHERQTLRTPRLHWTSECRVMSLCAVQYVVARHYGNDGAMRHCGAIPWRGGFSSITSLVCYLFNHLLTFLLFQEFNSIGLLIRIVRNDGIIAILHSIHRLQTINWTADAIGPYGDWFCCLLWPALGNQSFTILKLVLFLRGLPLHQSRACVNLSLGTRNVGLFALRHGNHPMGILSDGTIGSLFNTFVLKLNR
jgi:hypothetical protein